jgi:predicted GNAT superfamily acetyltransferase
MNDGPAIAVRPLHSNEDCHACVDLQRDVWGLDQTDVTPATLLHVVDYVGGIAAGAFDATGALAGFVFGISGVRDGDLVHWSHMLGVRESARDHGVGRMLKEYQRGALRALGVKRIYWSFDPLQSKNAHFNINRLRAVVESYVPDMYGQTRSPLHLGMATDRLIVRIDTDPHDSEPLRIASAQGVPILTPYPRLDDASMAPSDQTPDIVLIEIPEDILAVLDASPPTAQIWRTAVRDHFQWALARMYSIAGVHRGEGGRTFYIAVK